MHTTNSSSQMNLRLFSWEKGKIFRPSHIHRHQGPWQQKNKSLLCWSVLHTKHLPAQQLLSRRYLITYNSCDFSNTTINDIQLHFYLPVFKYLQSISTFLLQPYSQMSHSSLTLKLYPKHSETIQCLVQWLAFKKCMLHGFVTGSKPGDVGDYKSEYEPHNLPSSVYSTKSVSVHCLFNPFLL